MGSDATDGTGNVTSEAEAAVYGAATKPNATALQSVWRHHARPLRRHKPRLLALVCCVGDVVCQSGDLGWISAHLASLGRAWELSAGRKDSRVGVTVSRAPAILEA